MIPKTFTTTEILNNALVGFTFEFYSTLKEQLIINEISKSIGKQILITEENTINPTWSMGILLKEFKSKKPKYQLKLAIQDFPSMLPVLNNVLEWINEYGITQYDTLLKTELQFKHRYLPTLETISTMDKAKLILNINEKKIYNYFPLMKKSAFALSVKNITPIVSDIFLNETNFNILNNLYNLPNSNFYGIDLTDKQYGILKFNYIGESNYAKNKNNVVEVIKDYIFTTYETLNTKDLNENMITELNNLYEKYSKYRKYYFNVDLFLNENKNIKVSIDLKNDEQLIKTFWHKIRTPLIKILFESDLEKGKFNYDTDLNVYEIKNATLNNVVLEDLNIINCIISGNIKNCNFINTNVNRSRITNTTFIKGNNIDNSILENCRADRNNSINKSYIINDGEILNCKINESIIKNANIGKNAKLDENTIYITNEDNFKQTVKQGINVEEIRNYKWLKNLTSSPNINKDFGNEYKINY